MQQRSSLVFFIPLIIIGIYLQTLSFDFAYDDFGRIHEDLRISGSAEQGGGFSAIFSTADRPGNLYRPVTSGFFRLQVLLFGLSAPGFHLCSLLLHLLCALLWYRLLKYFKFSAALAVFFTCLWLAHPALTEAVANISGQAELLAAFFCLSAIIFFIPSTAEGKFSPRPWLSGILLLFSALSKESGLVCLLLMPLAAGAAGTINRKRIADLLPAVVFSLLALLLRFSVLGINFTTAPSYYIPENPLAHLPWSGRLIPALQVLGAYLTQLLLPFQLSADYSLARDAFEKSLYSLLGLKFLCLCLFFFWLLMRNRKEFTLYFGLWFLLAFSLTANIILPIGTIRADRLLYLPALGGILWWVLTLGQLFTSCGVSTGMRRFSALALLSIFCLISFKRVQVWKNNITLFERTVTDAPESPKARFILGMHYLSLPEKKPEAEQLFRESLQLHPRNIHAIHEMQVIAVSKGNLAEAAVWAAAGLKVNPTDARSLTLQRNLKKFSQKSRMTGLN